MGEQTETSRYYPDGTVRLPDALETWVDSVMEGDKGDDPDQRLTWDQVRNVVDVVLWQLIYRAADPDDLNEDAIRALLDVLDAVPRSDYIEARADTQEAQARLRGTRVHHAAGGCHHCYSALAGEQDAHDDVAADNARFFEDYQRGRAERAEADRHPGCTCPFTGDAPAMHHVYCAAHYGGGRHHDCVLRSEHDRDVEFIWRQVNEQQDQARERFDRAERAERERDEYRVLIDALANRECAGAYLCVGRGVSGRAFSPCDPCAARRLQAGKSVSDAESFRGGATPRAALSADVDADAEREAWGERSCATCGEHVPWEGTEPHGEGRCNTDAEPSRAEGGCVCHRGRDEVKHCPHHTLADDDAQQRLRDQRYGGGDDGRSRAIDAAFEATPLRLEECVSAIDAALASGGIAVVTGCPDCGFTYDAMHVDERVGGYWCPACEARDMETRLMAARAALEGRDGQ